MIEKLHSPRMVAEQIVWRRPQEKTTPMHVIKLVYLSHGWMLGIHGRSLIAEPVEAWRYGPVVPSVYHLYKSFRGGPIVTERVDRTSVFDDEQSSLIDAVVDAYRKYTAWMLSSITHQPGTPWDKVYMNGRGEGAIIPNRMIQDHYRQRLDG